MSTTILEALKELSESNLNEEIRDRRINDLFNQCVSDLVRIGYPVDKNEIYLEESSTKNNLGDCSAIPDEYGMFRIRLSRYLYNSTDEEIKDTILHELAHYLVAKKAIERGIYYRDGFTGHWTINSHDKSRWISHGEEWKNIINYINMRLGTKLSRVSGNADFRSAVQKDIKYEAECTNCHNKFHSFKKTRFMKDLIAGDASKYQCPYCKKWGMFKLLKNEG